MRFFLGKIAASCMRCGGNDWYLAEAAQSFNVLSKIVCTQCGTASSYADLALQAPLEGHEVSAPKL